MGPTSNIGESMKAGRGGQGQWRHRRRPRGRGRGRGFSHGHSNVHQSGSHEGNASNHSRGGSTGIEFGLQTPSPFDQNASILPGDGSSPMLGAPSVRTGSKPSTTTQAEMTESRFDELPIDANLKRAISEVFMYETMTVVQERSISISLTGVDVLAKARTGTGKTLAFLIPALQHAISNPSDGTSVLVISPTRELARQIAEETTSAARFSSCSMQVVFGGTNIRKELSMFQNGKPPTVIVSTPGRLLDHLRNEKSGFYQALTKLSVLILDEADQLLDMGFADEIASILRLLPPKATRQTLLFSATMPADVQRMANQAMKTKYEFIDCVGKEENTHATVSQSLLVVKLEEQMAALAVLLMECMRVADYKILVFFSTARQTQFCAELFAGMGRNVLEMHSRKSQKQRTRVSDTFRENRNEIMFTSDVTARGIDYPDVTTVIQIGMPADREQYIHRIGRTARAGKGGNGVLLLSDFEEEAFMRNMTDVQMQRIDGLPADRMSMMHNALDGAARKVERNTADRAYQAWLGFYNSNLRTLRWDKREAVAMANRWALEVAKLEEIPALTAMVAGKMGLRGVEGVRIESDGRGGSGGRRGSGGRGRYRGGRGGGT